MIENHYKIIIFDLDETLGYFQELSFFIDAVENVIKYKITKIELFKLLDEFSEFLRPNILNILEMIKLKKMKNKKIKVMIYTNNQNPKQWVLNIKDYFNNKLNYTLFDKVIAAFKVNGQQIEFNRTSHDKTYDDFIRCTKLPKNTSVCFIDDQYHPGMTNNNVYYIQLKPYAQTVDFRNMAERFYNNNNNIKIDKSLFVKSIYNYMEAIRLPTFEKTQDELNIDNIISKRIVYHLNKFINKKLNIKTQKMLKRKKNKTYKIIFTNNTK